MPRNRRRNEWTRTRHGGWTRSFGQRGMRVRLFQNRRGGTFYRAVWVHGRGREVASLETTDRDEAERRGRALLAALLQGSPVAQKSVVTLETLWERYRLEAPAFATCTTATRCLDGVAQSSRRHGRRDRWSAQPRSHPTAAAARSESSDARTGSPSTSPTAHRCANRLAARPGSPDRERPS